MKVEVRTAGEADLAQITPLYRQLFQLLADWQPFYLRPAEPDAAFLQRTLTDPAADILLAERGGEVAGFLLLQRQHTPDYTSVQPRPLVYVVDVLVAESARRGGVASALMAAAEQWGRARGADYMELSALAENRPARVFYMSRGWRPAAVVYRRRLDD